MTPPSPDNPRTGVRIYDIAFPSGEKLLVVALVVEGVEICRLPGEWVSRCRALLQRVEADHPGRTGTDEGVKEIPKTTVLSGTGGGDPTRN